MPDIVGFVMIFASAASVLLQSNMHAHGDAGVSGERRDAAGSAKLLVVIMGLAWGFNWVAARIILTALPPWTMRAVGIGLGDLTLFAAAAITGVSLAVPRGERVKILIAGFFNVAIFNVCSAYAQVYGTTSRAIVIAYSMPIWSALLRAFRAQGKAQRGEARRARACARPAWRF